MRCLQICLLVCFFAFLFVCLFVCLLFVWLLGWSVGRLVARLVGWWVGRSVGRLVGGWSVVGRSVCAYWVVRLFVCSNFFVLVEFYLCACLVYSLNGWWVGALVA